MDAIFLHYRSWLFLEGFYFPAGLSLPPFVVSVLCTQIAAASFVSPKAVFFCLYNRQLNSKNSVQNALEVDILRSKIKKILGRGNAPSPDPSPSGEGCPLATVRSTLPLPVCKSWIRHWMWFVHIVWNHNVCSMQFAWLKLMVYYHC